MSPNGCAHRLALALALLLCLCGRQAHAFEAPFEQLFVTGFLAGGTLGLALTGAFVVLYSRRAYAGDRGQAPLLPELDE